MDFPSVDCPAWYIWLCGFTQRQPSNKHYLRLKTLLALLANTPPGVIGEAGIHTGISGLMMAGFGASEYHGYDSFAGLVPSEHDDTEQAKPGLYATDQASVIAAFARMKDGNNHIHIGYIPQVFVGEPQRKYRFIHIDVDCYEPTLASLEFFWPQVVPGGMMVCDDFGWKGARLACEQFGNNYRLTKYNQAVWQKNI